MKRSTSTFFLILAVVNILVGVIPPCVGGFGASSFMGEIKLNINNRELGPELEKHIAKEAPLARIEAFTALALNTIFGLLLIGGSIALFMAQPWARWVCVGAGVCLILSLLVHDVYQIFFYRPVLLSFIDIHVPVHGPLAEGIKWGTTVSTLAWSCTNPLFMLYLTIMAGCMALMNGVKEVAPAGKEDKKRSKKYDDDDDDDRPSARRKKVDDDEDDRPRRKKRDRDDDD